MLSWSWVCQPLAVLPVTLRSVEKQGWVRVGPLQLLPHLSTAALSNWCCWKQGFPHCMEERNPDEWERWQMGHLSSRWLFLYLLMLLWLRVPHYECSLIQNHSVIFLFSNFSFANIHALPGFFGAFHTVLPMWLRVRLLQSFFFPSFKNSVDEPFPIQKLIKPAFVNS